jgi:hypothetical protein
MALLLSLKLLVWVIENGPATRPPLASKTWARMP